MNLLSFSVNDYEIQSTSNLSNESNRPFNDNIINYSSNGTSDSNHSVSNTSIALPNILKAPINTSNVAELQAIVQALRMEVLTLRDQPNSTSTLSNMPNIAVMPPMTTNNNTSTQQNVPILGNPSNNCSAQSMISNNHKINRKLPDLSCNSQSFSTLTNNNNSFPRLVSHNKKYALDPPEDDPFQHLICKPISKNKIHSNSSTLASPTIIKPPAFDTTTTTNVPQTHDIDSHVPNQTADIPIATTEQINLQQALQNIVIQ